MLSQRLMREAPTTVRDGLARRHAGSDAVGALEAWLALETRRRATATQHEALARATPDVAAPTDAPAIQARRAHVDALRSARRDLAELEASMRALALRLPNLPDRRVPDGAGPAQSVVLREWGQRPTRDFALRAHDELATALGLLDLPRAARLAGPRFPLLVGAGARLARALAALMLDLHATHGYVEVAPPHLLRAEALEGTGHLPRHEDDLYALAHDGLYLSPTAEAQLVALHAGETLPEAALPLAYTAWTPCFRREAGSAGTATRGLLRQHQFDKVELVRITAAETADAAFETLLADAEAVARRLELPYRVVALCAGELPFSAARTSDLEVWMPSQGRYVEISSVSDCGAFQARRLALRYRPTRGGRARYLHTLNGSALAIGRTLAALLEHGQHADGSVALPAALAPYLPERVLRERPDAP
ncbi:MAG: serine--tRNA ligase [Ktedonobacterales bacterium]|nr:serine--tRNA ligase [Ktedonobacterales bacterium]